MNIFASAAPKPPVIRPDSVQIAIETTGRSGSLAVLRGTSLVEQRQLRGDATTASSFALELQNLLSLCRRQKSSPAFVTVTRGPGSFTGVRIGMTAGKTLSYALGLPLAAVDSLAAIAATVFVEHSEVDDLLVGINAYRRQVFAGRFRRTDFLTIPNAGSGDAIVNQPREHDSPTRIIDQDAWQRELAELPETTFVAGDGTLFKDLPPHRAMDRQQVDAVGAALVGLEHALAGQWQDPISATPNYLRASAAEEKAGTKKASSS